MVWCKDVIYYITIAFTDLLQSYLAVLGVCGVVERAVYMYLCRALNIACMAEWMEWLDT